MFNILSVKLCLSQTWGLLAMRWMSWEPRIGNLDHPNFLLDKEHDPRLSEQKMIFLILLVQI